MTDLDAMAPIFTPQRVSDHPAKIKQVKFSLACTRRRRLLRPLFALLVLQFPDALDVASVCGGNCVLPSR